MSKNKSVFYVLDLDRTLFDTDAYVGKYIEIARQFDEKIAQKLQFIWSEQDISLRGWVSKEQGDLFQQNIEAMLEDKVAPDDLLMLGAKEFLAALPAKQIDFGIATFGDRLYQAHKLKLSGLSGIPYIMTGESKGELIASWQDENGLFTVPKELGDSSVKYSSIVLIDDKARSFKGLPRQARGYWLSETSDTILPSHEVAVKRITHLAQAII